MSYTIAFERGSMIDTEIDTLEEAEAIANASLEDAKAMRTKVIIVEEDDGIGMDDMYNPADDYDYPEYQGV